MFKCNYQPCENSKNMTKEKQNKIIFKPCLQCSEVWYCSDNCKKNDEPDHSKKCTGFDDDLISDMSKYDVDNLQQHQNQSMNDISQNQSMNMNKRSQNQNCNDSSSTANKTKKTLNDYEFVNLSKSNTSNLGKGAFGEVKLVKDKNDGKLYALKQIDKANIMKYSSDVHLKREIKLQKKLKHPHI